MFSFKIDQKDLNRIQQKLLGIEKQATNKSSALYKFRLKILTEYKDAVVSVMGEINGEEGGTMTSDSYLGDRFTVNWAPLAGRTMRLKKAKSYSLYIWEASGATKNAIKVHGENGFAGITKDDKEFERALNTEFGAEGSYESRALFTVANQIFLNHKQDIIDQVRSKVIETVIISSKWGS